MTLPTQAKRYVRAALASGFNGGIAAVAGIVGIDADRAFTSAGAAVTLLSVKEMAGALVGGFIIHFFMWLHAHPLDEDYDTSASIIPSSKPTP